MALEIITSASARLPAEAALFPAELAVFVEEVVVELGYAVEAELSNKEIILAGMLVAKRLLVPAKAKYMADLSEATGDGAGTVKFQTKLKSLESIEKSLNTAIGTAQAQLSTATDDGVGMVIV